MNFIVKSIRRFPYLFLTFLFASGIALEYTFQFDLANQIGLAFSFVVAISTFFLYVKMPTLSRSSKTSFLSILFILLVFFFLGGIFEHACHPISSDELQSFGATGVKERVAQIKSVPKLTKGGKISCESEVYLTAESRNGNGKVSVFALLTFDTCSVSFKKGDLVVISSSLKSTESNETIGFNYDTYLRKKGVEATSFVKDYRTLKSSDDLSLETYASDINLFLQNSVRTDNDVDECNARDLVVAITLGDKTDMDDGLKDAYSKAGTSHLLAVSGLHVGIIILIVEALVGFVIHPKRRRYAFAAVLLAIIWGYAFLTGLAASVVRTAFMYTVYRVAMLLFSKPNPINVVSFTAFVMLVYNPFNIFDLGFQLSFSAVYSILLFGQPLVNGFEKWMPEFKLKGRVGMCLSKLRTYVLGSVAISLSAQILTTPIILLTFHTLPILSIVSSLFTIPLVTLLIPLAFIYYGFFVLSTLLPVLTFVSSGVLFLALNVAKLVNTIVCYTADVSFCTVDRLPFCCYDVAVYVAVLLSVAAYYNYRRILLLWVSASISVVYFVGATIDGMATKKCRMLAVYNVNGVTAVNRLTETNTLFGCNDTLKVAKKAGEFWINRLMPSPSSAEETFFDFDNHRVYILSDKEEIKREPISPLEVDVLILTNNVTVSLSELKNFRFKKLIVDGSNKYYVAKKWSEEREKSGVDCHIVKLDGSWIECSNRK